MDDKEGKDFSFIVTFTSQRLASTATYAEPTPNFAYLFWELYGEQWGYEELTASTQFLLPPNAFGICKTG